MHHALGRQSSTKTLALRALGTVPARCTIDVTPTTTDRLARLETAQEIISMMIALRSEWIGQEQASSLPDATKIQAWLAEQDRLAAEEEALSMDDASALDRVVREYGPIVRTAFRG